MIKPFTREEWQDLMSNTMHGPLPHATLLRVFTTVDYLFAEKALAKDAWDEGWLTRHNMVKGRHENPYAEGV